MCPPPGRKVEPIFLNIDTVNTRHERPQVKTPLPLPYTPQSPPCAGGWDSLGTPPSPFTPQNGNVARPPGGHRLRALWRRVVWGGGKCPPS